MFECFECRDKHDDARKNCHDTTQGRQNKTDIACQTHQLFVESGKDKAHNKSNQQADGFECIFHFRYLVCFDEPIITKLKKRVNKNPTLRPELLLFFRVKLNHDFRRDFLHTTANEHDGRDSRQSRTQSSNEITDLTSEANQALVDRSKEHTSDEANQ